MGRIALRIGLAVVVIFVLRVWLRPGPATGPTMSPGGVVSVAADDPAMVAAIAKARATVNRFTTALAHPMAGQTGFAVKWPVKQGDAVEHFWVEDVTFDGKDFRGVIQDEPEQVTSVHPGQAVTVPLVEITDWMYLDGGQVVGAYTVQAIREMLSAEEQRKFDQRVHFKSDS